MRLCVDLRARGSCWALSWRDADLVVDCDGGGSRRFGVLAVVCGDGSCLILVLPKDDLTSRSVSVREKGLSKQPLTRSSSGGGAGARVVSLKSVCRYELRCQAAVTSVTWSPMTPQVCCGLSDGSLALWTLSPQQLAANEPLTPLRPGPTARFCDTSHSDSEPCHCAVKTVQFCPFSSQPDLLLATGYDSDLTVRTLHTHSFMA